MLSPLTSRNENNAIGFTHETYREFFYARESALNVNRKEQPLEDAAAAISSIGNLPTEFFLQFLSEEMLDHRFHSVLHDSELNPLASFQGYDLIGKGEKLIVCIDQDQCYCNPEAQICIANILFHLEKEHGLDLVTLEAGKGRYTLEQFRHNEDKAVREKVANYFFEKGIIQAGELFGIMTDKEDILWGVEDTTTFLQAAKSLGQYPDSPTKVEGDYSARYKRHNFWAYNTVEEALKRDSKMVALVFSNTGYSWYKEMAQMFRQNGYSSMLCTHKGPRGLGKNYHALSMGRIEDVDPVFGMIKKALGGKL